MTLTSLHWSPQRTPTAFSGSQNTPRKQVYLTIPGKTPLTLEQLASDIDAQARHIKLLRHIMATASRKFDSNGHKLLGVERILRNPNFLPLAEQLEGKPYQLVGAGSTALVFRLANDAKATKIRWTGSLFEHLPAVDLARLVKETPSIQQFVWVARPTATEGDLVLERQPWAPPVNYRSSRKEGFRKRIYDISHGLARRGLLLWDYPRDNFGRRKGVLKLLDIGALTRQPELATMTEAQRQKACQRYLDGII